MSAFPVWAAQAGVTPALDVWRPLTLSVGGEEITALGMDAGTGRMIRMTRMIRLAVGTRRGLLLGTIGELGTAGEPFARALHRGPVRGLAFVSGPTASESVLLASTDGGLHRIDDSSKTTFTPGTGARARLVGRIATVFGLTAVATAAGAFVSADTRSWQPLSASLPAGEVTAIAVRRRPVPGSDPDLAGFECWTVIRGRLWRTPLALREGTLTSGPSRQEPLPFAAADRGPIDLVFGLPDAEVVVVLPRILARRREPGNGWEMLRIGVPAGARIVRLAHALDRYWLATDRGLLEAATLDGPWRRAASPAGTASIRELVGNDRLLVVATAAGVLTRTLASRKHARGSSLAPLENDGPGIEPLHRAAIAYLELETHRTRALRQSVTRRGRLPVVTFRGGYDGDDDWSRDTDEAFISGDLRRLNDRDRRRSRNWDLTLTLTWDLADLAYHPELIDVSKETRALIELRDDVLDEITQLYYERRRVLAEIGATRDPATGVRLRLRADELAAGIDAWTGGWFGQNTTPLAP